MSALLIVKLLDFRYIRSSNVLTLSSNQALQRCEVFSKLFWGKDVGGHSTDQIRLCN